MVSRNYPEASGRSVRPAAGQFGFGCDPAAARSPTSTIVPQLAVCLTDLCQPCKVAHEMEDLLRQRIYAFTPS